MLLWSLTHVIHFEITLSFKGFAIYYLYLHCSDQCDSCTVWHAIRRGARTIEHRKLNTHFSLSWSCSLAWTSLMMSFTSVSMNVSVNREIKTYLAIQPPESPVCPCMGHTTTAGTNKHVAAAALPIELWSMVHLDLMSHTSPRMLLKFCWR